MLIALLGVLLFLSFGCASAGSGWSYSSVWAAGWGWQNLVALAGVIVALLLGIAYMAGSLLSDDKIKAWVRKEAGQVLYSAIILLIALGTIQVLDNALRFVIIAGGDSDWQAYIQNGVCCDPATHPCIKIATRPCHFEVAYDYLQMQYESLRRNLGSYLLNHYAGSLLSSLRAGFGARVLVHVGSFSAAPLSGLSIGNDYFSILFDLTLKNMMLLRAQQVFLDYFWLAFFPVMLSLGLVMRMFYFTRKLGGTLVALAIAGYYVFPMFYVLVDTVFFKFMGGAINPAVGPYYDPDDPVNLRLPFVGEPPDLSDTSYDVFDAANEPINVMDFCAGTVTQDEKDEWTGYMTDFKDRWGELEGSPFAMMLMNFFDVTTGSAFQPNGPVGTTGAMMVLGLVVPFLALMATLATFKVLSPALGGDIEIALISRLL